MFSRESESGDKKFYNDAIQKLTFLQFWSNRSVCASGNNLGGLQKGLSKVSETVQGFYYKQAVTCNSCEKIQDYYLFLLKLIVK